MFLTVPRKVLEWALTKKGIPDILIRSVISLYEGAMMRVGVDSKFSEEIEIKVGMHHGCVLSPFLSTVVIDVVTEFVREGALSELLYADYLVLMNETIKGFRNTFIKWKEVLTASV